MKSESESPNFKSPSLPLLMTILPILLKKVFDLGERAAEKAILWRKEEIQIMHLCYQRDLNLI